MSARIPRVGEVLRGDDGTALVVAEGSTALDSLLDMIEEEYGVPRFANDNPAIVAALPRVVVETWRSCTSQWREDEGVDDSVESWWGRDGDGKRSITVAYYEGSVYYLGEEAERAERAAPAPTGDER